MDRYTLYSPFELTIRGIDELRTYRLPIGVTTIGRNPGNDVFLAHVDISRQHATIECTPATDSQAATAVLQDAGSLNGTYLENVNLDKEPLRAAIPITLRPGVRIFIGTYTLTFNYHFTQMQLAVGRVVADDDDIARYNRPTTAYPYAGEIPPGLSRYSQRYLQYLPELYQPAAFSEHQTAHLAMIRNHEVAIHVIATDRLTGREINYPIGQHGAVFGLFDEQGVQELRMRPGHSSLTAYRQAMALQLAPQSVNDAPPQAPTSQGIGQVAVTYSLAITHDWGNTTLLNWAPDPQQPRIHLNNQVLPQQRLSTWPPNQPITYGNYELRWCYTPDVSTVSFLSRFLALFESITLPVESIINDFSLYLDPESSPREFLPWLERWFRLPFVHELAPEQQQELLLGLSFEQRRKLLIDAERLFAQKGTRVGLIRWLELFTQFVPGTQPSSSAPIVVDDLIPLGDHFVVQFNQTPTLDLLIIDVLIQAFKPVHTTYEVRMP